MRSKYEKIHYQLLENQNNFERFKDLHSNNIQEMKSLEIKIEESKCIEINLEEKLRKKESDIIYFTD